MPIALSHPTGRDDTELLWQRCDLAGGGGGGGGGRCGFRRRPERGKMSQTVDSPVRCTGMPAANEDGLAEPGLT
jgi:hypothetical protein